jgi:hypothetical protein
MNKLSLGVGGSKIVGNLLGVFGFGPKRKSLKGDPPHYENQSVENQRLTEI